MPDLAKSLVSQTKMLWPFRLYKDHFQASHPKSTMTSTSAIPDTGVGAGQEVNAHIPVRSTLPLPLEVNQMIYRLVFHKSYKVIWKGDDHDPPPSISLSLLGVSSTMYKEAHDPLYHESTFIFDLQEYRAVPAPVYKAKIQASKSVRLIVHHIYNPWSEFKSLTARIDRFIKTFADSRHNQRRLEIDLNKFAIKRLACLRTLDLFASFEKVEIHALVSNRTIYGGDRFHPFSNIGTTPAVTCNHMDVLVRRLESQFGPVKATRSGTEGMTHMDRRIRDSDAFYLHVTVRPKLAKQATGAGVGHWS